MPENFDFSLQNGTATPREGTIIRVNQRLKNGEGRAGRPPSPQRKQGVFATPENSSFYTKFSYLGLDKDSKEIRFVKVSRDKQSNRLDCVLLPAQSLDKSRGQYCALSYCTGNARDTCPIWLDGHEFNIFANLDHALRWILYHWDSNYPGKDCILWVDQICINQNNNEERSHQVGFKRDIYSGARGTFICLSGAGQEYVSGYGLIWLQRVQRLQMQSDELTGLEVERSLLDAMETKYFSTGWELFYDLVASPWWRRAWAHQEFLFSRVPVFIYHCRAVPWRRICGILPILCHALQGFDCAKFRSFLAKKDAKILFEINQLATYDLGCVELLTNRKLSWKPERDLKEILVHSRYCKSSDPRDRIFAFLGLAHPGYEIHPDYSESNTFSKLLLQTAVAIVKLEKSLSILPFAIRSANIESTQLPSWVPNWISTKFLGDKGFACLDWPAVDNKESYTQFVEDDGNLILQVRGLRIDHIRHDLPVRTNVPDDGAIKTENGHILRCRTLVQTGDEVWLLFSGRCPFILRGTEKGYLIISEAENIEIESFPADKICFQHLADLTSGCVEDLDTVHIV